MLADKEIIFDFFFTGHYNIILGVRLNNRGCQQVPESINSLSLPFTLKMGLQ